MIHFNHKLFILGILLCLVGKTGWGQLQITTGHSSEQLLQMLLGTGVEVSNVTGTGIQAGNGNWQAGKFYNGEYMQIGIDSGVLLTTGNALLAVGPNSSGNTAGQNNGPDDPDLTNIIGGANNKDACVLEFDFIPYYDTLRFRYVFGSEEYNEWINFADIFAFFVTGPNPAGGVYDKTNIALLPTTSTGNFTVQIPNVNNGSDCPAAGTCVNCNFFIDNCIVPGSPNSIEYDGYSVILTALLVVVPCQQYHIKLAIQDNSDENYDSGVFLEAGSFSSPGVALEPIYTTPGDEPFAVEGCTQANLKVTLPFANPDTSWVVFDSITGTATNGVDYNFLNDSVMFLPNQLSVTIPIVPVYDGLAEGDENIYIYLSNQVGCAGTNLQRSEIVLHNFTPVEIGSDTAVCEGTQVTFDAGEGYKNYTWHDGSNGDTWTSPGTPSVTQVSVSILDNYGCPSSDTLQLTTHSQPVQNPIRHQ